MRGRIGAGVAVLRADEALLVRRGDNGGWDVPGGGAQPGEPPEQAARRELCEETGLTVGDLHPLGVFPHRHTSPDGNVVDWETHVYAADFAGGDARAGDDASALRWWPLDRLPEDVSETTQAYFAALRTVAG